MQHPLAQTPFSRLAVLCLLAALATSYAQGADTLRSWNSGPTKFAVLQFVRDVTTEGSPQYVPPAKRVAVFSHDGTLFPEQPVPVETAYLLDRIKALIKKHPRWRSREPFRSALARNYKKLAAEGTRGVLEMSAAVHSGMTTDEYDAAVLAWLDRARYVRLDRLYSQATLLPMMELLTFLRESGFRIFIVTRGDAAFLRPWAFRIYGITPDHVIGSSIRTSYVVRKGVPLLVRKDAFDLLEDGPSRPQALFRAIGCRPIAAFGSSDADISMLQWVSGGNVRHLVLLVHHTNGGNEFAYDRRALYGRLDKGLITARKSGWVIADMTKDFNRFFQKIAN